MFLNVPRVESVFKQIDLNMEIQKSWFHLEAGNRKNKKIKNVYYCTMYSFKKKIQRTL